MPIRLTEAGQATVDGAGAATVTLGPGGAGRTWTVHRLSVACTGSAVPVASVYLNSKSPANLIDGTYTGSFDFSDVASLELQPGEHLVFVWSGATPGAIATAGVIGQQS